MGPRTERQRQIKVRLGLLRLIALKGRHVPLVDDVVTTGATITEAARVI